MMVGMTDEEPIREFLRILGVGNVDGPYQPKGKNRKPVWRWRLGGKEAIEAVFALFYPRLSPRRIQQFERVLANAARKKRLPASPDCGLGTYSGYARHRKQKTTPCQACREAYRTYMKEWRSKKALVSKSVQDA